MTPGLHGALPEWLGDIDTEVLLENLRNPTPDVGLIAAIRAGFPHGFGVHAYVTEDRRLVCVVLASLEPFEKGDSK